MHTASNVAAHGQPAPEILPWTREGREMPSFLALLAFLLAAGVHVERVSVPGPNGVNLDAALVLPEGAAKMPPVVALHWLRRSVPSAGRPMGRCAGQGRPYGSAAG
jgi:hypothetical protein